MRSSASLRRLATRLSVLPPSIAIQPATSSRRRDLVARDEEGKIVIVRYQAVNTMLLNEFLKEHRKVEDLEANAARQQKQIEALTAGLQKVSAQLEASKPEPRVVNNP